jgi:predicted nucleic acid-binding protein
MSHVTLVISPYVMMETLEHVQGHALQRFEALLEHMERVGDATSMELPPGITVVEKDLPVLASAVSSRVDILLTGDKNHFGHLYGTRLDQTLILPPGEFLEREIHRLIRP